MRPIVPNPIVVLDSEEPSVAVEVRPQTLQWDPNRTPAHRGTRPMPIKGVPPRPAVVSPPTSKAGMQPAFTGDTRWQSEWFDPASRRVEHVEESLSLPSSTAWIEVAERMPLPSGCREEMLPLGQPPRGPIQTRIAMTRLSRALGRDYRVLRGAILTVDGAGIEAVQQHASGSHGHDLSRDHILSELQPA